MSVSRKSGEPGSFWRLLVEGRDVVSEVPADRWNAKAFYDPEPGAPGKTNAVKGGFIEGIDLFDAGFFGISPREAALMDPQQRLILEVSADALEDAGFSMARIAGTETGVFVGISSYDYSTIQQGEFARMLIDAHSNTGGALSIAANRISYFFNLRGMSVALDTACSSSLVAAHLACEGLWRREITMALVGGVNVLIKPEPWIGFSRLSMLSPDGHCKAFDATANGFVRAEGAGMVVLKPFSRAREDGDRVYALILATGSNQDGRTSSMTVPGQEAQEALLRETCRRAGVAPHDIQFVEAHGTGTLVGDPIEARALGRVYGAGRAAGDCCVLGSVKTNIGHLEPAAGIAGMIKVALAMKHGLIPRNLHFREPNPDIPFDELHLRVQQELGPWPKAGRLLAGVNSFGFGGTNSHVIMASAPAQEARPSDVSAAARSRRPLLVPLAARSLEALRAMARIHKEHIVDPAESGLALEDIAWSTATRRTHHEHRLAVVAGTREELCDGLQAFANEESRPSVVSGRYLGKEPPKPVFVCAGQGPQWWGMGRELIACEPVFRAAVERCDKLLRREGSWSLLEELGRDELSSRLDETAVAQPAIFSIQVALASLWESWGIRPHAVVGHSVGEVAAAYLAGALGLEDAVKVIFHRGRCMDFAAARGKMLAVGLTPAEAAGLLKGREKEVSVAAINSPSGVTLSGEPDVLHEIAQELASQEVFHRFLKVNYAFHSPLMDPMRPELLEALKDITPGAPSLEMISTVTGAAVTAGELDAEYWWQNVRQPVRFASAIETLLDEGADTFVELSPHPVLAGNILECAGAKGKASATVLHSIRREEPERAAMLKALARLYTLGAPVDWRAINPQGQFVDLPRYPWQRERHWSESEESSRSRLAEHSHPLLGYRSAAAMPTWKNALDVRSLRFLNDHRVQGHVVLPATCYVEMAAFAASDFFGDGPVILEEIEIGRACFLPDSSATGTEVVLDPEDSTIQVYARGVDSRQTWTKHASGKLRWAPDLRAPEAVHIPRIRERCSREVSGDECYALLAAMGLEYGPSFRGIEKVWSGDGEVLGRIVAPPELDRSWADYRLHPALLDACLQLVAGLFQGDAASELGVYLPVAFEQVRLYRRSEKTVWGHARFVERQSRSVVADLSVFDDAGLPIVELKGVRCQAVDEARGESLSDLVYEYEWRLAAADVTGEDAASALPPPSEVGRKTREEAARIEVDLGLQGVALALERELDPLCSAFVWKALLDLGAGLSPGSRFSTDELVERCGIASRYRRVLGSFLKMLAADGFLKEIHSEWEVVGSPFTANPESDFGVLWLRYPASYAELCLVRRAAVPLARVLRGELDPLELIFPGGSLATTDHLYQHSPTMRPFNMMAASAISFVVDGLPEGRKLRLLEVGAGTGGLSSYVLSEIPRERTQYFFTDVSNHFFLKAQEQFRDYPFIEYKLLDIENDPAEQGFAPAAFDIVLAANVLHATKDLRQTVRNVKKLLAPGGLLLLLEGARPLRAMDLVFGLTEGFFRFEDRELRPSHALLPFSGWKGLLESEGFGDVTCGSDDGTARAQNNVILARREDPRDGDAAALVPTEQNEEVPDAGRWLLLTDGGWRGERLADALRARGGDVFIAMAGDQNRSLDDRRLEVVATNSADVRRLVDEIGSHGARCRGVVHMWNSRAPHLEDATDESLDGVMRLGNLSAVYLARALAEIKDGAPRLWIVTCGAEAVGGSRNTTNVAAAAVWGLNRVIMNEFPMLRSSSLDLSPSPTEEEIVALAGELLRDGEEDEVALRGRLRYLHRWNRLADRPARESGGTVSDGSTPFRLESLRPGLMDHLALRAYHRREPGPGQVEIDVAAAGLNFSDVMKALGLYPGLPDGPVPLGIECAGRIERVGEGVSEFRRGDAVVAVTPFSFGTHALAERAYVVPKPEHISFEQAATLPIAFLTAHYAINHLGRLARGERVLIHAATGGVGLAAIQLAWEAGAEVFVTAGTSEKRDLLRSLGIRHVMDSRSLDFADEVLEATGGEGIDMVLNSLSGEAIYKGLSVLRDYGRFLEIGKRDIYQNRRLGMRPFRKNVSFMAIDLDRGMRDRPQLFSRLLREVIESFERTGLRPLPHRVFPITHAVSAFRHMAQAKHLGKVVLSLRERRASVVPAAPKEVAFAGDGTYLISGGLGGFGLATARWIAERGGRHIVLMGRRGASTEEARAAVDDLRRRGIEVKVVAADVSIGAQVASTLADIDATMPPLRGVFHLALALRDALLMNLNEEQMREVWAPKVMGAFHLHRQTLGRPLDVFALYSSMSAVFGTGGQGNYASANSFLDALAFHRRSMGLPGLSVSWGFLGETGFVARHADVAQRFEAMGIKSFNPAQGLALLARFLGEERIHGGVMRVDWRRFEEIAAGRKISPRFAHLVKMAAEGKEEGSRRGGLALRKALLAANPSERRAILEAGLREQVGRVLGVASEKLDMETPLSDLGLDSLMAIELRNWVEGDLKVNLPAVELLKGPSLTKLVNHLVEQLPDKEGAALPKPSTDEKPVEAGEVHLQGDAAELLSMVDEMSDEQVDALLEQMEEKSSETSADKETP